MAASVFGTAGAAFAQSTAATQYVQNSMNFRSGASLSGTIIGSVPAGAKVDVLAYAGDWVQVRYNGVTGYIHAGNLADTAPSKTKTTTTSTTAAASSTGSGNTTLQQYMDNTWTSQAQNLNSNTGAWKSVKVSSGYLALRSQPTYEYANEVKMKTPPTGRSFPSAVLCYGWKILDQYLAEVQRELLLNILSYLACSGHCLL